MTLTILVFIVMAQMVIETKCIISRDKQQTLQFATSLIDVNFTDNVLWRMTTKNVGICGHHCYKDEQCLWLAYNPIDSICQGHNTTYNGQYSHAYISSFGSRNYYFTGQKLSLLRVQLTSSSVWPAAQMVPSSAVDGNPLTWFISGYELTSFPYFTLKWNSLISVTRVIVVKRAAVESRFEDVYVFMGYQNEDLNLCNKILAATSDSKAEFTCPYPMKGDVIKIEHRGPLKDSELPPAGFVFRILELAEVEVYGY